jgi:hypothetical protein
MRDKYTNEFRLKFTVLINGKYQFCNGMAIPAIEPTGKKYID